MADKPRKGKKAKKRLEYRQNDFDSSSGIKSANSNSPGAFKRPGSNKK